MKQPHFDSSGQDRKSWLSRRSLLRGTAGAVPGAGLFDPNWIRGSDAEDDSQYECMRRTQADPRRRHRAQAVWDFHTPNPLNPANPLPDLHDPSQITDFEGFVGLTHIRGGGTGTNTNTGETMPLASGRYGFQPGPL
jgi:hypothetical protein